MNFNRFQVQVGLIATLTFGSSVMVHAEIPDLPKIIDHFYVVSAGIYRGARPSTEGVNALALAGVRTVVNLENDEDAVTEEHKLAQSLGMEFVSLPMHGFWAPKDSTVNAALKVLADSTRGPVFIHCRFGRDRTGLIVGLHRIETEQWRRDDAYAEMLDLGFRPQFLGLKYYFDERTRGRNIEPALALTL